jgi:hypothetical protein
MSTNDWRREEVEAIVDDYLSMLASELAGTPYNKAAHRRALQPRLGGRSDKSIEFKHANISAALLDAGFPFITGYKPLAHYQDLVADVLAERMARASGLHEIAAADADRPMAVPEVEDILTVLTQRPQSSAAEPLRVAESSPIRMTTNYIEREARNRSLGNAGELFVINYERARLIQAGKESLAARIEHTAVVRGDHEGYDVLSFDESGAERLIEVKTTKYGAETPFFVTRNEVSTSERRSSLYQLYRLYAFRTTPRLYTLPGAIGQSCLLAAATFQARPR